MLRFFSPSFHCFFAALLCGTIATAAETSKPKLRSFRPVVPIKQNVSGGMDQMKSKTITMRIPPPPIPDTASIPEPMDISAPSEKPAPEEAQTQANLPPEKSTMESPESAPGDVTEEEEKELPPPPADAKPDQEEDAAPKKDGPTLEMLRAEAHALAEQKLTYIFGAEDPESGGLDCSATIQYLLNKIGVKDVPRTSYDQYAWMKKNKTLDDVYGKAANEKLFKKLSPGDLIFWGGTWNSGHRVSHVMLYMGYDAKTDKHYIFGARGKSVKGLTGCGVDIFELGQQKGRLIAHGKIPGLVY
jgi:cell wall-associated NlpC family hydrolase